MVILFTMLRLWQWLDDTPRSLLPEVSGLALLEDYTQVTNLIPLPTDTFGAELSVVGLYSSAVNDIPAGTISIVYVRDDWRYVEIDYLPTMTVEAYLVSHIHPTQEVKLDQEQSVWIQTVDDRPRCIDYEDELPNRCEISRYLIAQLDNRLLLIAADGDHPTDGELIEMARSIVDATQTR